MLTFFEVTQINAARCEIWHAEMTEWNLADWANAMQGEAGELGNVVKKLRRWETGQQGSQDLDVADLVIQVGQEAADTFLYLDLVITNLIAFCEYYNLTPPPTLAQSIIDKFNAVSDRESDKYPAFTGFKL